MCAVIIVAYVQAIKIVEISLKIFTFIKQLRIVDDIDMIIILFSHDRTLDTSVVNGPQRGAELNSNFIMNKLI